MSLDLLFAVADRRKTVAVPGVVEISLSRKLPMILCRPHRAAKSNTLCQARSTPPPSRLAGPVFLPPASPSPWARTLIEAARKAAETEILAIDSRPATAAGG